jgi:hypothetical protein
MPISKSNGERGFPCLNPSPCELGEPAIPVRRTWEVELAKMAVIQFRNRLGKPLFEEDQVNSPTS